MTRAEPAAPPAAVVDDGAWARVKQEAWLPGLAFMKATFDFGGRVTLPASAVSEAMRDGVAVVVAPTGVFIEGQPVASIEGGEIAAKDRDRQQEYMVSELGEPMKRGLAALVDSAKARGDLDPWLTVTLYADASTPFRVILALLFTSGKAGAFAYQFAVTPIGKPPELGSPVLSVSPPKYTTANTPPPKRPEKLQLVLMVSRTDVRVGRHLPYAKERSAWLERVPVGEDPTAAMRRVSELARAVHGEEQWSPEDGPVVLMGAEQDVPLGLLVAAMVAVAGPECVMDDMFGLRPHRCLFVARVLHGGSPAPPELIRQ